MVRANVDSLEVLRSYANAGRALYRMADKNFATIGLTVREFQVLRMLVEFGPSPMVALANELLITQAGTTSVVDRLEKNRLIERVRSKEDRRIINIQITNKGKKIFVRGAVLHKKFVKKSLSLLTDRELGLLLTAFEKISRGAEIGQAEERRVALTGGKNIRRR